MAQSTNKKVSVARFDKPALPGFAQLPEGLTGEGLQLLTPDGGLVRIPLTEIRAVCFVRDFDVREAIYQALRSPDSRVQMNMGENRGISFDYTFDRTIGHNSRHKPMPTIRVAVGWHGKVITAYPVR